MENKIKMGSPPKRGRPRREQSSKVVYLRHLKFNRWNNLKKLLSNKDDRTYSNDHLASSFIELYKCSVGRAHGRLSCTGRPAVNSL